MNSMGVCRGLLGVATMAAVLSSTACTGDPDVDLNDLGVVLNDDGSALVEQFRTNEPRMGEVTAETVVDDATTDRECAHGVQRVFHSDFTLVWPGDPADLSTVDTYFDGTTDFLAGRFGDLGYSVETQEFGDSDQPRSVVYRRNVEDDVDVEFTVGYQLAESQGDADTISADFSVVGSTSCVES